LIQYFSSKLADLPQENSIEPRLLMGNSSAELPLEIDCASVSARVSSGADMLLLDCREVDEHALVRIDGAELIPMSEIQQRAAELTTHKERPIVVFCHHGMRSLMVARWLRSQGYLAQSMGGGIDAWAAEIDPSLERY
jgi:rhodanese-related sulfurtransferase